MSAEFAILDWMQGLHNDFLDRVMIVITGLGNGGVLWIVMAAILLIIPRTRPVGLAVALALILDLITCNLILKPLVARTRPCDINTFIELLIERPLDYSFPSGHTAASFAAVSALFFFGSRLWIPAAVLACLIAFSRLYHYVHFPTDVVGGMILGVAVGALAVYAVKRMYKMDRGERLSRRGGGGVKK